MSDNYRLPNFKAYLDEQGMSMREFQEAAFKTVGTNVSAKTWSNGVNARGVGLRSINKMILVAEKTFNALGKAYPNSVVEKKPVPSRKKVEINAKV